MESLFEHNRYFPEAEEQSAYSQTEPVLPSSLVDEQTTGAEDEEEFEEELIIEDFTIDGICGVY
ncbi:mycofactocin precursor MftA [Thermogemmatispora tikiterensis]|uniref:Mycofactocin n=1 Tax=Thermogemmatispora tikiterensis TaxID=1825093 RepID=A0A328VJH8_9CHLR|nr:mycofactocin precursor MftA [Thermogemmatispora tikiterensis]RAQ95264.1 mycofactocin precursor [Thermogemmatispora tikiterensis]